MDKAPEPDPLLSVITVTWNAKKYVDLCLRSLDHIEDIPLEIIVVDNASTDGTQEMIVKEFKDFHLIRNEQNLGFAKANNIGIRQSRGRYICLVNSDVVVPIGCLSRLLEYMDANPSVGIVGPQMLAPDGGVRRSCMRSPSLWGLIGRSLGVDRSPFFSRLFSSPIMSDFGHDRIADVEILNGWFWMVRRQALDQVGLLDERFFMYGEDLDWCRRFRKAGWRLVFDPDVRAVHYGGASSSAAPERFYVEMQRADLQYWRKHHGPIALLAFRGIQFSHNLLRLMGYIVAYSMNIGRKMEVAVKIRRSWAVLAWMVGIRIKSLGGDEPSRNLSI